MPNGGRPPLVSPDMVKSLARPKPEKVEVEVVCGGARGVGNEGEGVGGFDIVQRSKGSHDVERWVQL